MTASLELPEIAPGTILAKKYRVDAALGRGGMATVYAATHVELGDRVAIKVLHRHLVASKAAVVRFRNEAKTAARVRGPHTATVLDVDELETGEAFIVMELLTGEDLSTRLARDRRLPSVDAVRIVMQACEGVRVAHASGVIHRDIKPSNLFLCAAPAAGVHVKVVDFGISRVPGAGAGVTLTQGDAILGSPHYMAPEQMADPRTVDGRADIWSMGCTLYRALVGEPPFPGDNLPMVCANVMTLTPPLPHSVEPTIPPGLSAVVMRCLEKNRALRYGSIEELAKALEPFSREAPRQAPAQATVRLPPEPPKQAPPGTIRLAQPAPAPEPAAARELAAAPPPGMSQPPVAVSPAPHVPTAAPLPTTNRRVVVIALIAAVVGAALAITILQLRPWASSADTTSGKEHKKRRRDRDDDDTRPIESSSTAPKRAPSAFAAPSPTATTPELPARPKVDWSKRSVPDLTRAELDARVKSTGYTLASRRISDDGDFERTEYTFSSPCVGGALYFKFKTAQKAEVLARGYRSVVDALVLQTDRFVLTVTMRAPTGAAHPGCNEAFADAFTR